MKPRVYQNIGVLPEVHVSSSCEYSFRFHVGMALVWYYFYRVIPPRTKRYPNYVYETVERQILDMIRAGKLRFYECDRDGNKRYENLRYHSADSFEWVIKRLEQAYPDA